MAITFPLEGRSEAEVMADLWRSAGALDHYQDHQILGFPGTYPPAIALDALGLFSRFNPNNIMTHTGEAGGAGEGERSAFAATHGLERQVVYMVGSLLGGDHADPVEHALDGYLASGGTEANIMGLWIGRNKLLAGEQVGQRGLSAGKICVIVPVSAHYSFRKACDLLGMGEGSWHDCAEGSACTTLATLQAERGETFSPVPGTASDALLKHRFVPNADSRGLALVSLDEERYRAQVEDVNEKIDEALDQGIRKFIVVATAGTTMMGTFDPIEELGELIQHRERDGSGAEFYFHVDAAFGGLVAPFLKQPVKPFDFRVARVDSMAVDPQKMGMVPYPAGLFLCRKGYQQHAARAVAYISSHNDDTILGSRPGSAAAACWAVFSHFGRNGYTDGKRQVDGFAQIVEACMENTHYLEARLTALGVRVFAPTINILAAEFPSHLYDPRELGKVARRYHIVPELFSRTTEECPRRVYRFTVMPHVRQATIEQFIKDLEVLAREG